MISLILDPGQYLTVQEKIIEALRKRKWPIRRFTATPHLLRDGKVQHFQRKKQQMERVSCVLSPPHSQIHEKKSLSIPKVKVSNYGRI
jgi:hypothetical protein